MSLLHLCTLREFQSKFYFLKNQQQPHFAQPPNCQTVYIVVSYNMIQEVLFRKYRYSRQYIDTTQVIRMHKGAMKAVK